MSITKLASLLALGLCLTSASLARADEPASAAHASAPAEPAGTGADPNIDRGFLLPTAMTQPQGTVTYNNYELLLHGVTYGLTDRVQLTATVLSPITKDIPLFGLGAVKAQIVSAGAFHLALQGTAGIAHELQGAGETLETVGGGALASVCLRDDCASLASASATYQAMFGGNETRAQHLVLYGGSLVLRLSEHVKLLGEVASAAGGSTQDFKNVDGLVVSYGVRFHTRAIAADVGFIRPMSTGDADINLLLGLPFVNVSYRWQ